MQPGMRRRVCLLAAGALAAHWAVGQESRPAERLLEQFERVHAAHFRQLLEAGESLVLPFAREQDASRHRALLGAYAGELRGLLERFPGDPAQERVRWELGRTLSEMGRAEEARPVLSALDPDGLEPLSRLLAARELALLGARWPADRLVQGLAPESFETPGQRLLLAAMHAFSGRGEQALAALGGLPDAPQEKALEVGEYAKAARALPLVLERSLLALLYREWAAADPDSPEAVQAGALARGLALAPGDPAPPLESLGCAAVEQAAAEGRPMVLLFYDPGSPVWSEEALQGWTRLAATGGPKGLVCVGVVLAPEGLAPPVQAPWPTLSPEGGWRSGLARAFGVTRMPLAFWIDRQGRLAALAERAEALASLIQALAENKPPQGQGPPPRREDG